MALFSEINQEPTEVTFKKEISVHFCLVQYTHNDMTISIFHISLRLQKINQLF